MIDQKITNYIQECRRLKITDSEISKKLASAGWPADLVNQAISWYPEKKVSDKKVLIDIKNLEKVYEPYRNIKTPALLGINIEVYEGEFVSITGPSGSGKTTMLNLIGLIDEPTSGEILINNQNIHKLRERKKVNFRLKLISFIFQFYNLIDHYTAFENIFFQLRLQGLRRKEAKKKSQEILEFLGLKERSNFLPTKLSGGEQQRVAVGRALAKDSLIILADEPTAHLDSKNGQAIISFLREINLKFKRTIVLVTHELEYAKQADRMIVLRDGKVVENKDLLIV